MEYKPENDEPIRIRSVEVLSDDWAVLRKTTLDYHRRERGLAVLTGRVGAGKTTATRAHIKRLAPSSYLPLYAAVPSGCNNPLKAVVESLMNDLGEKIYPLNPSRTLQTLYQNHGKVNLEGTPPENPSANTPGSQDQMQPASPGDVVAPLTPDQPAIQH